MGTTLKYRLKKEYKRVIVNSETLCHKIIRGDLTFEVLPSSKTDKTLRSRIPSQTVNYELQTNNNCVTVTISRIDNTSGK